jgi:hypothetical protein
MNFSRSISVAFLSFALSLVVLQTSDAQTEEKYTETFQQSYQLSATGRVSLENINGNVRVEVWDKNEIKVEAVKSANMQEKLKDLEIKIDSGADSIRIKVKYPNTTYNSKSKDDWRRQNPGEVDFVLTVPRSARIDAIELINGRIDLKDLTGEVEASSINGRVTATNLTGDCKLSTINGKTIASFDRVDSGRNISLSSVNGQVEVTLPSDLNAQIKASVVHGSISNNFGLNVRKGEYVGRDMNGVLGNGGARINLSNVNGNITVNRANDGKQLSNVTNLISATNDSKSPKLDKNDDIQISSEELRELEEEYAEAMREAQQEMRDAQREVERARRELQRATENLERAKRNAEQNPDDEDAKQELEEAKEEQKDAERELREAEKEVRNAQREIERNQRDRAREFERAKEEIKRAQEEAKRAIDAAKITQDVNRITQEAMKNVEVYGDYNNLRVVERDSVVFNTKSTPFIDASTYDGSITIRAWDKNEVSCTVTKRAEDDQQIKGVKFNAAQNGNQIIIKTEFDKAYMKKYKGGVYSNAVASFEINVPRSANLKINSSDGRLRIEGVNGNIEAKTGDGGIEVRDCNGRVDIDTGDGRIYVVNHQGEANIKTGDGNIVIEGRFTKLSATTGDGSIVLSIPSNTNATIEAEAESVLVDGLTATEESGKSERLKRWRIGTGGPIFKLHTGDGRISVRKME